MRRIDFSNILRDPEGWVLSIDIVLSNYHTKILMIGKIRNKMCLC